MGNATDFFKGPCSYRLLQKALGQRLDNRYLANGPEIKAYSLFAIREKVRIQDVFQKWHSGLTSVNEQAIVRHVLPSGRSDPANLMTEPL